MSPNTVQPGSARSAAAINDQIRELWARAGGQLSTEQRREYQLLVTRWAAAVERERQAAPGHDETAPAPRGNEGRQTLAA